MARESANTGKQQAVNKRPVALLFELEHSAVGGRVAFFEVCKRLFAEREVELTDALFMRYFQGLPIEKCVADLLDQVGKKRLSSAKLAAEIVDELKVAMGDKHLKMTSGLSKLLAQAKTHDAVFGVLTALPKDVAEALVTRLGLDGTLAKIHYAAPGAVSFPTADAWLKLAKAVAVPPQGCVVLTADQAACRAALSGGMRPVALPDELTGYQDFGGSDLLVDKLNDEAIAAIVSLMAQSR